MGRKSKKQKLVKNIATIVAVIVLAIFGYQLNEGNLDEYINQNWVIDFTETTENSSSNSLNNTKLNENKLQNISLENIPEYSSSPYVELNDNEPYFTEEERAKENTSKAFEKYSEWDSLGRSGVAFANICKETMPAEGEERGEIGSIKNLSGWVQARYDDLISDKYLYNRCHLIGWQLSAENANKNNLITGTRYLNIEGMLPFENIVAEYIKDNSSYHVLYRATPIYDGENLLASGVEIEAWSVEDNGEGISFNVYCYNVQPGVEINYATGESKAK